MRDDACNFEFFYKGVHRKNNSKRDLEEFYRKRRLQTISNLQRIEKEGKEGKFYASPKSNKPVDNSAAKFYDKMKARRERILEQKKEEEGDLDAILKHIKITLLNGEKKLKTISPDLIDQIYRFENLNDFQKFSDLDEVIED